MFDGGLAGAQVRNLLQEIGTLLERAGDELLDGIFDAVGRGEGSDGLDFDGDGSRSAERGGEIATSNFLRTDSRLQIKLRLRGGALGFEQVGARGEALVETVLRGLLHGLRVGEVGLGGLRLRGGAEHAVISFFDLIDDAAMGVVEAEICSKQLRGSRLDAGGASEVEDGVVQLDGEVGGGDGLAEEIGVDEQRLAANVSGGDGAEDGIPLAPGDASSCGLCFGALPAESRLRIVLLGKINEFGERVGLAGVNRKLRCRKAPALVLDLLLVGRAPPAIGRCRHGLSGYARAGGHREKRGEAEAEQEPVYWHQQLLVMVTARYTVVGTVFVRECAAFLG